jgi:peptidyl-prolyl cis-trans isomerase C
MVEQLVDRVLSKEIFVAEARGFGLDKDEQFVRQIKQEEDTRLLSEIKNEMVRDINVPADEEQILAYFNENKELFGTSRLVKIDQIWCQDLKTAQEVKAELDGGRDFESVKEQRSLEPKGKPYNSYPRNEGIFFEDLWKCEPNETAGPIKGFYRDGFKWRVVKILEKKPGEPREYTDDMKNNVKWRMQSEQRNAALERFKKELLEKYPYKIYADRIRDIDPLNIP